MAYFSTWRPHENRVLETRFTTFIKTRPFRDQNIPREEPKKKKTEREKNPGSVAVRDPGQAATQARQRGARRPTQATRDLGRAT